MQVELDIFSGRPNPYWFLTPEQISKFLKKISNLSERKLKAFDNEKLGYRKIIISKIRVMECEYDTIEVHDELLIAKKKNQIVKIFDDKSHKLEIWLFNTSKGNLEESLIKDLFSRIFGKLNQVE